MQPFQLGFPLSPFYNTKQKTKQEICNVALTQGGTKGNASCSKGFLRCTTKQMFSVMLVLFGLKLGGAEVTM